MKKYNLEIILTLLNLRNIGPSFIVKNASKILSLIHTKAGVGNILLVCKKGGYNKEEIADAKENALSILKICEKNQINIFSLFDKEFVEIAASGQIFFPIIYSLGKPTYNKTIGIIGSRNFTETSAQIAQRIGAFCVKNKFNILNGLADGIDIMSTNSEGVKKNVIGVAPGGLAFDEYNTLNKTYLKNAKEILNEGGCLFSQYFPYIKQDQFTVVEYCKLQAVLSDALILIQSLKDGGSRFAVKQFCQEDKTLFVVNTRKHDENQAKYEANNLIISKKHAGIAEWCKIKPEKVKCKIEVINNKNDYAKILSLIDVQTDSPTLF